MNTISKTAIIHQNVVIEEDVIIHDYVVIYPGTIIKAGVEIFDHCVIGKIPLAPGCTSREVKTVFNATVIGEKTILSPGCIIYAGTVVGNNTLLGDNCSIREDCEIGSFSIISRNVTVNYNTKIGNHTKVMDNAHITGNAIIGNNVFISVLVATTNDNTMGREEYDDGHVGGPIIEDGVTVGAAANILPNVRIGANSIIGASALVTKDVPSGKVVMGVPGKVVRDV